MERHPSFLNRKFSNLSSSPEIEAIAQRTAVKTGEKPTIDRDVRVQNYLDYLKDSLGLEDESRDIDNQPNRFEVDRRTRSEKLIQFKSVLYDKFVLKYENIPDSYWKTQSTIVKEEGRGGDFVKDENGDIIFSDEEKQQQADILIADQKSSLDSWVDYLASPDVQYPDWLKYYAFRSVLTMAEYDKQKKSFPERNKGTTKAFPDINREALSQVLDVLEKKYDKKDIDLDILSQEDKTKLNQLLQGENFSKLYSFFIEKFIPASQEQLKITDGKWEKYPQGSNHMSLVKSLQGHSTGWCTVGEAVAQRYLHNGDLHVYYSLDTNNQPTIPRAAICMDEDGIFEVRGIAFQQNLDPYIGKVVQQKLTEFPDGKIYEKKNSDMKTLTALETKINAGKQITREDLIFLYEIDQPIQGFGYQKDPRIEELRKTRKDINFDTCLIFDCSSEQIAHNQQEVREDTKVYIGPLFPNIFKILINIENIFTSFPNGKIKIDTMTIGEKTKEQLEAELEKQNIQVYSAAKFLMNTKDFSITTETEHVKFARLTVKDLFNDLDNHSTDEIYDKANQFGLKLCQSQDGPNYRLQYIDQPKEECVMIGMKQIFGVGGDPEVFILDVADNGRNLDAGFTPPEFEWDNSYRFVFRLAFLPYFS